MKQLIPAGKVFDVFVTIVLGNNSIELTSVEERNQLSEDEFILKHSNQIKLMRNYKFKSVCSEDLCN